MEKLIEELKNTNEKYVIYYNIPFSDSKEAKQLGAKWSMSKKLWFGLDDNQELLNKFSKYRPCSYFCKYCNNTYDNRKDVHRESILLHSFIVDDDYATELIQQYICNTCKRKEKKQQKELANRLANRTQEQIDYDEGMQRAANR